MNSYERLFMLHKKINSLTHLEFYDCQMNDEDVSSLSYLTFSKEQYWFVTVAEMRRQIQEGRDQGEKSGSWNSLFSIAFRVKNNNSNFFF